jgi:hypothetical protein
MLLKQKLEVGSPARIALLQIDSVQYVNPHEINMRIVEEIIVSINFVLSCVELKRQ